ncbi:MAG: MT-A70 family methyltransferase [Cyanobacteria bacterium P01_F01_bin.86]
MKYELIYADPAWQYRDKASAGKRGACHKYPVMSVDDICRLPVKNIADNDCLLAMWWVGPQPMEALRVVEAWGFTLKNMTGFTWHKLTKTGKSHFGMGHWTRGNCENVLFAVRGKPKRINAGVRQFVEAQHRGHSTKPDEVRDRLVQLVGDVPRIELFAREKTPGWDVWGNEVECVDTALTKGAA